MALTPRDIPVTREMVQQWIEEWDESNKSETLEGWIRRQIKELNLSDNTVDTSGHDNLSDETSLADFILMDIGSYATDS